MKIKEILLLCAGSLLLYTPFSGKPLHIDSPVTVYVSEQLLVNPLTPPAGEYGPLLWHWNTTTMPSESVYHSTPHPPLISCWLALIMKIAGTNEFVINWAFFPFYALSIIFFYLLCKHIGIRERLGAAVLYAVSPILYINAQNAMYDVPLGMFCIGTFYFMFRNTRNSSALVAGIFAGLACLVKFTAGTLIPVGIFYYVIRKSWRPLALFCGMALLFNVVWLLHNLYFYNAWQLAETGSATFYPGDLRYRFERMLSSLGALTLLPVFILYLWYRSRTHKRTIGIVSALTLLWSALLVTVLNYSITSAALYWICSTAGATLLFFVNRFLTIDNYGRHDPKHLTLWLQTALQIAGGLILYSYASRYSLPYAFIIIICLVLTAQQVLKQNEYRWFITLSMVCSLLFSISLSMSDYQIVSSEKSAANEVTARYPDQHIFYKGRLGYLHYMFRSGANSLTNHHLQPQTGDIVVRNCFNSDDADFFINHHENIQLIDSLKYPLFPLRTIGGRAGFYGGERLPFAWVSKPSKRLFEIYRVK